MAEFMLFLEIQFGHGFSQFRMEKERVISKSAAAPRRSEYRSFDRPTCQGQDYAISRGRQSTPVARCSGLGWNGLKLLEEVKIIATICRDVGLRACEGCI